MAHLRGEIPDKIRLKIEQLFEAMERCQKCHQHEFANWQAGPHHRTTYAKTFLAAKPTRKRLPFDDCLRCHGTHFEGSIGDLVTLVDATGRGT